MFLPQPPEADVLQQRGRSALAEHGVRLKTRIPPSPTRRRAATATACRAGAALYPCRLPQPPGIPSATRRALGAVQPVDAAERLQGRAASARPAWRPTTCAGLRRPPPEAGYAARAAWRSSTCIRSMSPPIRSVSPVKRFPSSPPVETTRPRARSQVPQSSHSYGMGRACPTEACVGQARVPVAAPSSRRRTISVALPLPPAPHSAPTSPGRSADRYLLHSHSYIRMLMRQRGVSKPPADTAARASSRQRPATASPTVAYGHLRCAPLSPSSVSIKQTIGLDNGFGRIGTQRLLPGSEAWRRELLAPVDTGTKPRPAYASRPTLNIATCTDKRTICQLTRRVLYSWV